SPVYDVGVRGPHIDASHWAPNPRFQSGSRQRIVVKAARRSLDVGLPIAQMLACPFESVGINVQYVKGNPADYSPQSVRPLSCPFLLEFRVACRTVNSVCDQRPFGLSMAGKQSEIERLQHRTPVMTAGPRRYSSGLRPTLS